MLKVPQAEGPLLRDAKSRTGRRVMTIKDPAKNPGRCAGLVSFAPFARKIAVTQAPASGMKVWFVTLAAFFVIPSEAEGSTRVSRSPERSRGGFAWAVGQPGKEMRPIARSCSLRICLLLSCNVAGPTDP